MLLAVPQAAITGLSSFILHPCKTVSYSKQLPHRMEQLAGSEQRWPLVPPAALPTILSQRQAHLVSSPTLGES